MPIRIAASAMLTWMSICAMWLAPLYAQPQPGVATAVKIIDARSRGPIERALVLVGEATFTTDAQGRVEIVASANTSAIVVANGYKVANISLRGVPLSIALRPDADVETIIVSGETPEQTKSTSYKLTGSEIARIPGAANDALRAIQSLPGVARIPFSFGGLALRGMSPRDTAVFLDGIEVPLVFHFGGLQSFVPSQIIDTMDVQLGGFETRFGRIQGGIVDITSIDPRVDKWRIGGEVSLLHTSLYAEGPRQKSGDAGVLLAIRRSYIDAFIRPFVPSDVPLPSYFDAQARLSWGNAKTTGHWAPILVTSWDRVSSDATAVNLAFVRGAVKYTRRLRDELILAVTPWVGATTISFVEKNGIGNDDNVEFKRPVYNFGTRGDVTRDYAWGHARVGLDVQGGYLGLTQINGGDFDTGDGGDDDDDEVPATLFSSRWWTDVGLWGELRYAPTPAWAVKPGLRLDYFGLTNELVVDPRLNLQQTVSDELTLRQAVGIFHQEPAPTELDTPFAEQKLKSSTTYQTSAGAEMKLPEEIATSLVLFWHESRELPVRSDNGDDILNSDGMSPALFEIVTEYVGDGSYRRNLGNGRSMGLEVSARRYVGRWMSSISYTYAKSKRTEDPALYRGWHAYALDQPHRLHVVNSVRLGNWQVGAKVTLVSGNPYTPTVADEHGDDADPDHRLSLSRRLPTFFQLDVRFDRRWKKQHGELTLFFDVQNATLRKNIEGRSEYVEQGLDGEWRIARDDIKGLPILPIIGLMFTPY